MAILDLDNYAAEDTVNGQVLRAKNGAISTALSTLAKVEDTALRRQTADRLPFLIKLAEEVRASMPSLADLQARQRRLEAPPYADVLDLSPGSALEPPASPSPP